MKWWVWVLLLVNVGLFAYFNVNAPKTEVANKEINPEKLKVLSAKDLEAMPKKVAPLPEATPEQLAISAQVVTCYKWGNFTSTNLPSAQVVLARLGLQADVNPEPIEQQDKRFWVYYPPLKNAELARQKAEEIKALGVEELYIVQDSQWRNAISFGLFSDEQLASSLLTSLQEKGVKGATKALRSPGKSLSSLLIKAVTSDAALELHKIKPEFVGTDLAPAACS
jgi:hypothetical protein